MVPPPVLDRKAAMTKDKQARGTRRRGQRGMVTAELAIGILTTAIVLGIACWVVSLVVLQTHCADTASQVARQLARGDTKAADEARGRAPKGARTVVQHGAGTVRVAVDVDSSWGRIGPVHLKGEATAHLEPGVTQ